MGLSFFHPCWWSFHFQSVAVALVFRSQAPKIDRSIRGTGWWASTVAMGQWPCSRSRGRWFSATFLGEISVKKRSEDCFMWFMQNWESSKMMMLLDGKPQDWGSSDELLPKKDWPQTWPWILPSVLSLGIQNLRQLEECRMKQLLKIEIMRAGGLLEPLGFETISLRFRVPLIKAY